MNNPVDDGNAKAIIEDGTRNIESLTFKSDTSTV